MNKRLLGALALLCTGYASGAEHGEPCDTGRFVVSAHFPGGAMGGCEALSGDQVRLYVEPEDEPINPSPWYSFQVTGSGQLTITLDYGDHEHRYWPKWSQDGEQWRRVAEDDFTLSGDNKRLTLQVEVPRRIHISAQELVTSADYDRWLNRLTREYPGLTRFQAGVSRSGKPLFGAATNPEAGNVILLVGRQHPPEVTGAIALFAFVERLLAYHPRSCNEGRLCRFYEDTNIVFVPLLNPDGVDAGYWRHNLDGVDLNRDWRDFSQPEIRAMRDLTDRLAATGTIRLFIDFHSTRRDLFYTQDQGFRTSPEDFAQRWLALAEAKGAGAMENAPRRTTRLGTSKNYIHARFGIPAITYEVGDETPREETGKAASALADAMIEVLFPYRQGLDLLLTGGLVIDGTGSPGFMANVGIHGDRVVYIGPDSPPAARSINVSGKLVTPGFIDPHTHTDGDLKDPATALNTAYLHQGVTTVFIGNDGLGRAFEEEAAKISQARPGTNVALWRGHNALRRELVGPDDRPATEAELRAMAAALEEDVRAGALGLSTGLFYAPGSYADTAEVIRLARAAAAHGGHYDSHIRDESDYSIGLLAALAEVVQISRAADIPAHIAHIKALGPAVAGQARDIVALIARARAEGLQITADQYPWLASGTRLSNALVPRWAQSGGHDALQARLENAPVRARLLAAMSGNLQRRGGAGKLLITGESPYRGQTLAEVATALNLSAETAALAIIRQGDPAVASFMMTPADVTLLMAQDWVVTGSDGSPGHPRKFGTFPEKFQRYVRELAVLSRAAFVRRSSGLTAEIFNLCDRGILAPGRKADVAVWDPEQFQSRADYENPTEPATGVAYLLVNGYVAIEQGELTGRRGGHVIHARDCR